MGVTTAKIALRGEHESQCEMLLSCDLCLGGSVLLGSWRMDVASSDCMIGTFDVALKSTLDAEDVAAVAWVPGVLQVSDHASVGCEHASLLDVLMCRGRQPGHTCCELHAAWLISDLLTMHQLLPALRARVLGELRAQIEAPLVFEINDTHAMFGSQRCLMEKRAAGGAVVQAVVRLREFLHHTAHSDAGRFALPVVAAFPLPQGPMSPMFLLPGGAQPLSQFTGTAYDLLDGLLELVSSFHLSGFVRLGVFPANLCVIDGSTLRLRSLESSVSVGTGLPVNLALSPLPFAIERPHVLFEIIRGVRSTIFTGSNGSEDRAGIAATVFWFATGAPLIDDAAGIADVARRVCDYVGIRERLASIPDANLRDEIFSLMH